VKTVIERLGELQLQVSLISYGRGGSSYATYRSDTDPTSPEDRLRLAGAVAKATGRCRKLSLHTPGDVRTEEDATKISGMIQEQGLEAAGFYPDLFVARKGGVLNHRLMYGTLCSPHTDVRVASINFAIRSLELMRAMGCRQAILWIPDGIDSPGEKNLTDMLDRILNGLRQIGLNIRKSENLMLEFRPWDPSFCSMAVSDWGTAAWLARETDSSFKVLLDTGALLPGASLDSIVVAMLHQKVLGMVRLSDNRLSQGVLPAGTLDPASLFRFFLNLLLAEKAGLCSIPEMVFEVGVNTRVGEPGEAVVRAAHNVESAFASAMLINPDELAELQGKPDPALAEKLLADAVLTDVRPILKAWREEKGLPTEPLQALRASRVLSNL
jgi:L-rhamnose isomerase/sugar isomerase